jgi:LCP family protein required for cell wall assembly
VRRRLLRGAQALISLVAVGMIVVTGFGWVKTHDMFTGITTSQALEGDPGSSGGEQNILIMGLDSRLDEHGNPLPQEIYDALHAGDETTGGYNSNVLIVVHIPAGNGPITAISIPRDDFVDLAGCPTSSCKGKVKQAYGMAYQNAMDSMAKKSSSKSTDDDPTVNEQKAREVGRKAQINTVRNLLGIPIDHFIEVTLVAFFEIAQVVQPITVCLNEDTKDTFSGADFHKGTQQINASQAMAFVRQRRDVNDELMFTDLDRTRRQQAFIVSLLSALQHGGSLSKTSDLNKLLDVARQNIAVDSGFNLPAFLKDAPSFTSRGISLFTLPITGFSRDSLGEDINTVDVPTIRSIVRHLVKGESPKPSSTSTAGSSSSSVDNAAATTTSGIVLNVVNASEYYGLATRVLAAQTKKGFEPGDITTADTVADESTVTYGSGAQEAAEALARELNMTATASESVAADSVELTIGTDFPSSDFASGTETTGSSAATTTSSTPVATVSATATGTQAPAPTDLTRMTMDKAPCVK